MHGMGCLHQDKTRSGDAITPPDGGRDQTTRLKTLINPPTEENPMTPLQDLLARFRAESPTVRDQGTAFERLMLDYFQTEPQYRDLYHTVQPYAAWAATHLDELHLGSTGDAGIDLVATTHDGEYHAIQCKNYAADHTLQKKDIDSFFTASGKTYFSHRIIVTTTNHWSKNAADALHGQQTAVSTITLP